MGMLMQSIQKIGRGLREKWGRRPSTNRSSDSEQIESFPGKKVSQTTDQVVERMLNLNGM